MTSETSLPVADLVPCRPWPRQVLTQHEWSALIHAVPNAPLVLLAVWADTVQVHALLLDEAAAAIIAVSTPVEDGRYPAVSAALPHAAGFERMIRDLGGHVAEGPHGTHPLLDHGP